MLKYVGTFDDLVHIGALYKFNGSSGSANTAFQADIGGQFQGASIDAYYSKVNDAITATSLDRRSSRRSSELGYSVSNSLAATISDNTTFAVMALYKFDPLKFFAGYEHIKYANPSKPLQAGFTDIGGYILAFVTNNAYDNDKIVQVYWTGVRYTVIPPLDLTAAYYGYHQNAYGTGKEAGCSTAAQQRLQRQLRGLFLRCRLPLQQALRRLPRRDVQRRARWSGQRLLYTTNIDPTIGVRYKF